MSEALVLALAQYESMLGLIPTVPSNTFCYSDADLAAWLIKTGDYNLALEVLHLRGCAPQLVFQTLLASQSPELLDEFGFMLEYHIQAQVWFEMLARVTSNAPFAAALIRHVPPQHAENIIACLRANPRVNARELEESIAQYQFWKNLAN